MIEMCVYFYLICVLMTSSKDIVKINLRYVLYMNVKVDISD